MTKILETTDSQIRIYSQLKYYRKICEKDRKNYFMYLPTALVNGHQDPNKRFAVQLADIFVNGAWQSCIILNLNEFQCVSPIPNEKNFELNNTHNNPQTKQNTQHKATEGAD